MKTNRAIALLMILSSVAACTKKDSATADSTPVVADTAAPVAAAPAPPSAESLSGMMNPNSMSDVEMAAAGVPAASATALAAGRPYTSMRDVDKVLAKGVSEKQRDSVYARVWIPIDLNTATDAEILLIPGIGPRMLREFKEKSANTSTRTRSPDWRNT